jgi:hypothetical protein
MTYTRIQITSAGIDFDNSTPTGQAINTLAYTTAPVTLLGNVVINPISITAGIEVSFSLRWEAILTLSTFSVVVAGVTFPQDQVNQNGTFSCYYDGTAWSVQYFADGKDQPQAAQGVTNIPVPVGGTKTLVAGVDTAYQRLVGSPTTLTSNYTVTAAGGVKAGSQFQIEIAGGITIGANTLTVFGISINANQALNGGVIILATFDGISTWVAASTSRPITTADITPVAARTVMGNASNVTAAPSNITFPTDFGVLQRNGTGLTTGLLTASSFDPTSIVANRVSIVNLTSSQVKLLKTTPIAIVPASGLNTVNIISSITVSCTYAAVTYTGDTNLVAYFPTAFDKLYEGVDLLGFTTTSITQMNNINIGAQTYQYVANEALLLSTITSNPLTGDGTIKVTVIYQTIQS